jgi:hypothetical protein
MLERELAPESPAFRQRLLHILARHLIESAHKEKIPVTADRRHTVQKLRERPRLRALKRLKGAMRSFKAVEFSIVD